MSYELAFDRRALKEWRKPDAGVRQQFKRKLASILEHPRIPVAAQHQLVGPLVCGRRRLNMNVRFA